MPPAAPPAVRLARSADVPALVDAYRWLFAPPGSEPPAWDPGRAARRLHELLAEAQVAVLVAAHDGPPAGFCTVYLDIRSVRFGPRAWVEDLAVDPARRSQGIGKALLDAAKAWARARGASHLELDSGLERRDAHRFYERERPAWTSLSFGWRLDSD